MVFKLRFGPEHNCLTLKNDRMKEQNETPICGFYAKKKKFKEKKNRKKESEENSLQFSMFFSTFKAFRESHS